MTINFYSLLGAIDGKHIEVQAPKTVDLCILIMKALTPLYLLEVCDAHYQ